MNIFLNLDTIYTQFNEDINTCTIKNQEKTTIIQLQPKYKITTKRHTELLNQIQELFSEENIKILKQENQTILESAIQIEVKN